MFQHVSTRRILINFLERVNLLADRLGVVRVINDRVRQYDLI